MNLSKITKSAALLAIATALSACGGGMGGGSGGNGEDDVSNVVPIDGMSYAVLGEKLGVSEDTDKEFAFTSERTIGGRIRFTNGNEHDNGMPDGDQAVSITFDTTDGVDTYHQTSRDSFIEGYSESTTRRAAVDTIDVNGNSVIYARTEILDTYDEETYTGNGTFVYIPSNAQSDIYVGMAGNAASDKTNIGIFGKRTSSDQVAAQRGTATYRGVTHGYATATAGGNDGEYIGTATATVNFDAAGAPSFVTSGSGNHVVNGNRVTGYAISGTINANGALVGTTASIEGANANIVNLGGALFGPNAENIGMVYDLRTTDIPSGQTYPTNVNGGAILAK